MPKRSREGWFKLLLVILPALREALEELLESIKKDSENGKRITRTEAENVAAVALAAIHEKVVELLQAGC